MKKRKGPSEGCLLLRATTSNGFPSRPNPLFPGRNDAKMLPIRQKPRSTGREAIETSSSKSLWQRLCHITRILAPPCQGGAKKSHSGESKDLPANKKAGRGIPRSAFLKCVILYYSTTGPAATRALPASLVSYFLKFLTKRPARSLAFSSQTDASA